MLRKIKSIIMAVLLMLSIIAAPSYALDTSLTLSQYSAVSGDDITASGQSDSNTWVSIKILDSDQIIVHFDAVKSDADGNYSSVFTVPDVSAGILNVIAGYGTNVTSRNLTISTSTGGGGSGGGNGGGSNTDEDFTADFSTRSLEPENTVLRFDFSKGIDQNLDACLAQIHVYKTEDSTPVQYCDEKYIKQGSNSEPNVAKIRRLELTYDNLEPGTNYSVEIDPDFTANNGQVITGGTSWDFTTTGYPPSTIGDQVTSDGGIVTGFGVIITIPADAFSSDIEVTLEELDDTSALPLPDKSKLISNVVEINKDVDGDFSKPVIISMSFDPDQIDQDKYSLSIYWLDETTNQWVELDNIKIDITAGTVSGEVMHFTKFAIIATEQAPPVVNPVNLNDIAGHWAEAYIKQMAASGAVSGYPDGSFQPEANISRAEFVTMLVKAFGLEMKAGKIFEDTANSWAKEYVSTACAYGIAGGYSDSLFGPDDPITREQMAVMLVKAAEFGIAEGGKTFTDEAQISSWAKEAVDIAAARQIMTGYQDGSFGPQKFATRAEAVTVLVIGLK